LIDVTIVLWVIVALVMAMLALHRLLVAASEARGCRSAGGSYPGTVESMTTSYAATRFAVMPPRDALPIAQRPGASAA
jgi:hypothetical protein